MRSKKSGLLWFFIIFCLIMLAGMLMMKQNKVTLFHPIYADSVFSWESEYLLEENAQLVNETMEKLECSVIYQQIPADMDRKIVFDYLKNRKAMRQDVYYLTGDADWGIEEHGTSMAGQVALVADWNKRAPKGTGFAGIIWDVEPYLLPEWKEDKTAVINQLVKNCAMAYSLAKESNLQVIICIPNFYDTVKLEEQLEMLISTGCDAVAVMNYDKTDEAAQISTEAAFAKQYQKALIQITELQKPGYHELTEMNTYYYDGIDGVRESWKRLKQKIDYEQLGFSWHYLKPAISLLNEEVSQNE